MMSPLRRFTLIAVALLIVICVGSLLYRGADLTEKFEELTRVDEPVEEPPEMKLRVRIIPPPAAKEPSPEPPKAAPAPPPLPAAAPAPPPRVPDRAPTSTASAGKSTPGSFINSVFEYRSRLGFAGYVAMIKKHRGRFFLYSRSLRQIVAEVDMASPTLRPREDISSLSSLSRVIADEPIVDEYLTLAQEVYGPGRYEVIFLWPMGIEARLSNQIRAALSAQCPGADDIAEIRGRYVGGGGIRIEVYQAVDGHGRPVPVTFTITI